MGKTVKVYSHDGANITIVEIPKEDIENGRLTGKYFTDYDECKEDRDLTRKIEDLVHNAVKRTATLDTFQLDHYKKQCDRGQEMLLGRIKEVESELPSKWYGRILAISITLSIIALVN